LRHCLARSRATLKNSMKIDGYGRSSQRVHRSGVILDRNAVGLPKALL
jgi:hypothetical protein